MLNINKLPQRVAGVTGRIKLKRVGATLKNFFFRKIHKVGLCGWGRSKRNRVVRVNWNRLDAYCYFANSVSRITLKNRLAV